MSIVKQRRDTGSTREMTYRFYDDNGMFRLNIPNDVDGVTWARADHDGIALVSRGPEGGPALRLKILRPGQEVTEAMARSFALGTWGRTRTLAYGWYQRRCRAVTVLGGTRGSPHLHSPSRSVPASGAGENVEC